MHFLDIPEDCFHLIVQYLVTEGCFTFGVLYFPLVCKQIYNIDKKNKNIIELISANMLKTLPYQPYNFFYYSKKSYFQSNYYRLCALTRRTPCTKCLRRYRVVCRCHNCGACPGCDMCQVCYGSCNKCLVGFEETDNGLVCTFCKV